MDLLSDDMFELMIKSYFPDISNLKNFKKMHIKINHCLANDEWLELQKAQLLISQSQFVKNEDLMREFSSRIIVPGKQWSYLKRGKTENSQILTRIIDVVSYFGSKETTVKLLTKHNGIEVLVNLINDQNCTELELKCCLRSLFKLLEKTGDFEYAKLMVPAATRFLHLIETKKVHFEVFMVGVQLIHAISSSQGPKDLMSEVFKSGVSSYAVKVLNLSQKYRPEKDLGDILCVWSALCRTIQITLMKKSASFNKCHVPTVCKELLKIIHVSVEDLHKDTDDKLIAINSAMLLLLLLVENNEKVSELYKIEDIGIIKEVANFINVVLKVGELNRFSYGSVCNGYIIIDKMITIEPSVRPIAPILTTIYQSFCNDKTSFSSSSHAGKVASFCVQAVKRGNKKDVKYLVKGGLIPLLAKLRDYVTCLSSLTEFVDVLYDLIIKVPETDDFFCFKEREYDALRSHLNLQNYLNPVSFICGKGKLKKNTTSLIYAIAALGISYMMCLDEAMLKSLDGHFCRLFQEIKSCVIPKQYPGMFLVKKMAKVKSFKSSVLPHIWYIAEHGPVELVKDLFESLPDLEEPIKVKSQDEEKDQVLKHVLVEVKAVFDRKSDYQTSDLIKLTKFLTTIPCSEQDDVVLYHLEDLVSPCLGLLEDQSNEEIIRLVKQFINNLHYS